MSQGRSLQTWAPLLKRTCQPQGWPTLIFENSIVGFGGVSHPPSSCREGRHPAALLCPCWVYGPPHDTFAISREPQPLAGPQRLPADPGTQKMLRQGGLSRLPRLPRTFLSFCCRPLHHPDLLYPLFSLFPFFRKFRAEREKQERPGRG